MRMPESRLSIVFFPWFTFSGNSNMTYYMSSVKFLLLAEKAVYGIIIFDLLGLLGKFQLFDHAAHLAGSGFGLYVFCVTTRNMVSWINYLFSFYALYGEQWYRAYFQPAVISLYYRLTGNGTKTNRVKDKKKRWIFELWFNKYIVNCYAFLSVWFFLAINYLFVGIF